VRGAPQSGSAAARAHGAEARVKFGIDIGGTKIAGAVIGADGATLARARLPNPRGDYAGAVANVAAVVDEMAQAVGARPGRLGVCVSGNVDRAAGAIRLGTAWWLRDRPFRDDLAAATGAAVRLANDADCFALSEAADGAAAGRRTVFGVILGTGFGGGFVVEGRLVTGPLGVAGEIGHAPMPWGTPEELAAGPCSCGRHGCIETLLAGPGFAADHARATGRTGADALRGEEVIAAADAGDPDAQASVARYQERLGRVLAMLLNIVEPEAFVFCGGLSNVERLWRGAAPHIGDFVFGGRWATDLLGAVHGDSSGVRGAARLWDDGR
jgi:fructokinase